MDEKLIILPAFTETQSISSTIFRSIMLHRKISEMVQHMMIPVPAYEQLSMEDLEIGYEKGLSYPENAVLRVLSESGHSIQAESLSKSFRRYETVLGNLKTEEDESSFYHSEVLNDSVNQLKKRVIGLQQAANVLPVLMVDYKKDFSLDGSHIQKMGNGEWIEDVLLFFKRLTEASIVINDEKIDFDSFLFFQNGRIARFIHFDSLNVSDGEDVVWQNIKALKKLMVDFYDYFSEYIDQYPGFHQHDTSFSRLYTQIVDNDNIVFTSFDEILAVFHNQTLPVSSSERVGVFIDVANIYTGMKNLRVDYIKLFSAIYGRENTKYIKDKFAFFFDPVKKNEVVRKQHEDIQAALKEQGFAIDISHNGQARAKQIVDGVERDEDDAKMIQRMEERLSRLTSVLMLSGDQDYLDILNKYTEHGKKVKVISTHPNSTSNLIVAEFDHSYITDYWDCILLKEEE